MREAVGASTRAGTHPDLLWNQLPTLGLPRTWERLEVDPGSGAGSRDRP